MIGITFDDEIHTYTDFGMKMTSLSIGLPDVKKKVIDLKGADGIMDLTEIFGRPLYGNRQIVATFDLEEKDYTNWASNISRIGNYLHGQKRKIVLDNDKNFYYEGRITEEHTKENKPYSLVTLTMDCYPFKREVQDSTKYCWNWDRFSFVDGIIREYGNIRIEGDYTLVIVGREQVVIPTIYSDADMTVTFLGKVYSLKPGRNYIYNIVIREGRNELLFHGSGTVSVEYRGGKL